MKCHSEFIREYECEKCHSTVRVFKITDATGIISERSIGCNCEILENIYAHQQKVNQERINRIFNQFSLINKSLMAASFETFNPYSEQLKNAYQITRNYAETFNPIKSGNLFFQSSTFGNGKSHLSMSAIKTVKKKGYTTIFTSTPKLLTKIRSTYNKNSAVSEDEMIDNIVSANLVAFDDIGAENAGGWGYEKLFEIIDQRSGKPSIFTTNLNNDDFKSDRNLERIFSRMMDKSTVITLEQVPDYRLRGFAKRVDPHG